MYRFLEGILVPKTSRVSPQTPKVFERGSEYQGTAWLWKVPEGFPNGIHGTGTPEIDTVWDYKTLCGIIIPRCRLSLDVADRRVVVRDTPLPKM